MFVFNFYPFFSFFVFIAAAWIFRKVNGQWQQEAKLVPQGYKPVYGQLAFFGTSVSINYDGTVVFVGGYHDNYGIGANWVFGYNATTTTWSQQGNKLFGTDYSGQPFQGTSVAITPDGNTAIFGGN